MNMHRPRYETLERVSIGALYTVVGLFVLGALFSVFDLRAVPDLDRMMAQTRGATSAQEEVSVNTAGDVAWHEAVRQHVNSVFDVVRETGNRVMAGDMFRITQIGAPASAPVRNEAGVPVGQAELNSFAALQPARNPIDGTLLINTPLQLRNSLAVTGTSTLATTTINSSLSATAALFGAASVDGTVDASGVVAGSVDATSVAGGSVAADTLDATTLNATQLTASTLNSTDLATLAVLEVAGATQLNTVSIASSTEVAGVVRALGGLTTAGADVDLAGGSLFAANVVNEVVAGDNVTVEGSRNEPVISVSTDDLVGVLSVNDETGDIELDDGTDIRISNLRISNRSTLASVRGRGGCSDCIRDNDVRDALTVSGGVINDTPIGSSTPRTGRFTTLRVGSSTATSTPLAVESNATSTFVGSIDISSGCFAIGGTCIGGAAATNYIQLNDTPGSLLAGALQFVNATGSALVQSNEFVFRDDNLGIGTSSPQYRLTVSGSINMDGSNSGLFIRGNRFLYASSSNSSISIGENAGKNFSSNTTNNIALGYGAGQNASSTSADANTYIGTQAGQNSSGANNIFVGDSSGQDSSGARNNALGTDAGRENVGTDNNMLGKDAGRNNSGNDNNLIGDQAGRNNLGENNNFFGENVGRDNSGSRNNFIGEQVGYSNTGSYNNFIGYQAGGRMSASNTIAIGRASLRGGAGMVSGGLTASTSNNTAVGAFAGYNVQTSGNNNLLLGYRAAESLTTGSNNIVIGYDVEAPSNTASNQLNIGNLIFSEGIDGTGTSLSSGNLGVGTSTPSSKLTVAGDIYGSGALTVNGPVSLRGASSARFYDADSSDFVGFRASSTLATSTTWSLPGVDGSTNQVLVTDGDGSLRFDSVSAIGGGAENYLELLDTPSTYVAGALQFASATGSDLTQSNQLVYQNGSLGVGVATPTERVVVDGTVRFRGPGSLTGFVYDRTSDQVGVGVSSPEDKFTVQGGSILQRGGTASSTYVPELIGGTNLSARGNDVEVRSVYAFVAKGVSSNEFQVLNISDKTNPVTIAGISLPDAANAVALQGDYAFVGSDVSSDDFHVIDIRDPVNPTEVASLNLTTSVNTVEVRGQYAFVGTGAAGDDLHIIDISTPTAPVEVGSVDLADGVNGIAVQNNYAYAVTTLQGDDFHVVDISTPTAPTEVDSIPLPDTANDVAVRSGFAYAVTGAAGDDFHTIDVTNPSAVSEVGSVDFVTSLSSVSLAGSFAYVTSFGSNDDVHVIDISSPSTPIEIGGVDLAAGDALALRVVGTNVFAVSSNIGESFHIVDVFGVEAQSGLVSSLAAGSVDVADDMTVAGRLATELGLYVGREGIQNDGVLKVSGIGTSTISGSLAIGTTTARSELTVDGTIDATNLRGGAVGLATDANGNIIRDPSDRRLKTDIRPIEDALATVLELDGVRYAWQDTGRFGSQTEIGFIAQDVYPVLPEVVRTGGDYWSLNTRNITAVIVEAMKELWQRVRGNQDKISALEARVQQLESRLATSTASDAAGEANETITTETGDTSATTGDLSNVKDSKEDKSGSQVRDSGTPSSASTSVESNMASTSKATTTASSSASSTSSSGEGVEKDTHKPSTRDATLDAAAEHTSHATGSIESSTGGVAASSTTYSDTTHENEATSTSPSQSNSSSEQQGKVDSEKKVGTSTDKDTSTSRASSSKE
jgi:hypothetical protein